MKKILMLGTSELWNNTDASPIKYRASLIEEDNGTRPMSNYIIDLVDDTNDIRSLYFGMNQLSQLVAANTLLSINDVEVHVARTNKENRCSLVNGNLSVYSIGYGDDYTGFNIDITKNTDTYSTVISYSPVNNDLSTLESNINTPITFISETLNPFELIEHFKSSEHYYHKFINMNVSTVVKNVVTSEIYSGNINYIKLPYVYGEYSSTVYNVKLNCIENITTKSNVIELQHGNSTINSIVVNKLTSNIDLNTSQFKTEKYKVSGFDITSTDSSKRPSITCSTNNENVVIDDSLFPTINATSLSGNPERFTLTIETTDTFKLYDINDQTFKYLDNKYAFDDSTIEIYNSALDYEVDLTVEYSSLVQSFETYGNMSNTNTLKVVDFDDNIEFFHRLLEVYIPDNTTLTEKEYNVLLDQILSDPNMYSKLGLDVTDIENMINLSNDWLIKKSNILIITNNTVTSKYFDTSLSPMYETINGIPTNVPTKCIFIDNVNGIIDVECNVGTYSALESISSNLILENNILNPTNYDYEYISDIMDYWDEYDMSEYVRTNNITDIIILGAYIDNSPTTVTTKTYPTYVPINTEFYLPDYLPGVNYEEVLDISIVDIEYDLSTVDDKPYKFIITNASNTSQESKMLDIVVTITTTCNYDYYALCNTLFDYEDSEISFPVDIKLEFMPISEDVDVKDDLYTEYIKSIEYKASGLERSNIITACAGFDLKYLNDDRVGSIAILSVLLEYIAVLDFKSKRSYSINELFPDILDQTIRYDLSESVISRIEESNIEFYLSDSSLNYRCVVARNNHKLDILRQNIYKSITKSVIADINSLTSRYLGDYVDGDLVAMEIEVELRYMYSSVISELYFTFNDYTGSLFEELNFILELTYLNTTDKLIIPLSV